MTPFVADPDFTLYVGDALEVLAGLPDESVHCVVTSPPYWGLRDYQTGSWEGGDPDCDHETVAARNGRGGSGAPGKQTVGAFPSEFAAAECGKCGATRVDRQIGLEATPDMFVAAMVRVFREVRRVLRTDGTCWLNLGDSYASGNGAGDSGRAGVSAVTGNTTANVQSRAPIVAGLKPKDLVGIPWSVAKALQAPYYTGRIKDERDRIWLAAMIDAEGCIHIHRRKAGTDSGAKFTKKDGTTVSYARTQDTYGVMVSVDNTSKAVIDRIHAIVGQGSRYTHEAGAGQQKRKQTLYRITLTGQQSRELLRELYPHLVAKQHEARIAYNAPSSGEQGAAYHEAIKALHNGRESTIDAPAPPTLFEPGWYLRSDICWSKSNPMPESVTDRPTKAHEYVFLLTKASRYFYDAAAIAEPASFYGPNGMPQKGPHAGQMRGRAKKNPTWEERKAAGATRGNVAFGENVGAGTQRGVHGEGVSHDLGNGLTRNVRSVWEIATQPYPEAHFATFPEALPERCIRAGTSERGCCPECGAPWERETEREGLTTTEKRKALGYSKKRGAGGVKVTQDLDYAGGHGSNLRPVTTTGWRPTCEHGYVVCPGCNNLGHGSSTAQVRGVRGAVLEGTDAPADSPLLLEALREPLDGTEQGEHQGLRDGPEGLQADPGAAASDGEPGGLRDGASASDGRASGPDADTGRSGASPKRPEGGQPAREPRADGEAAPRSPAETTEEADRVPALRGDDHPLGTCEECGSGLVLVPPAPVPAVCLDPFMGSGTTALVARRLGRRSIGIELNGEYAALAARRLQQLSLLAEVPG